MTTGEAVGTVYNKQGNGTAANRRFKYRLAFVVREVCVLRYDNESGKGDHRHFNGKESHYKFESPGLLIAAFKADIARYRRENSDA